MRAAAALWCAGCAEQMVVDDWGELDGTELLVDEPDEVFSQRVHLADQPRARMLPDSPVLQGPRGGWPLFPVVVDPTPWPRVSVDVYPVRVLLYADPAGLQPRVVQFADGTGRDGDGLVRLTTGMWADRIDEDGDRVKVRAEESPLAVEAWLPRAAVDEVWEDDGLGLTPLPPADTVERGLRDGAEIYDEPGGEPLATVRIERPYGRAPAQQQVDEDGLPVWMAQVDLAAWARGHVPVTVELPWVQVQGWIREEDLAEEVRIVEYPGSGFRGCARYPYEENEGGAFVPRGTYLSSRPGGPVVALALDDVLVPESTLEQGYIWRRTTEFGVVELWMDPNDARPDTERREFELWIDP